MASRSPALYCNDLQEWAVTITWQGDSIASSHRLLIPAKDQDKNDHSEEDQHTMAYEKTLAITLITGADPSKHGMLIAHLSNQCAVGRDMYPPQTRRRQAYNLLVNYQTLKNTTRPRTTVTHKMPAIAVPPVTNAVAFAQHGSVAGNNGLLTHK